MGKIIVVIMSCIILFGCNQYNSSNKKASFLSNTRLLRIEDSVNKLSNEIDVLKNKNNDDLVGSLNSNIKWIQGSSMPFYIAELNKKDIYFQLVNIDGFLFPIRYKEKQKYEDGYKIVIQILNPYFIRISDLKIVADWQKDPKGTLKRTEIISSNGLQSGRYNDVSIYLPGSTNDTDNIVLTFHIEKLGAIYN